jgi:branched-chain amino acid transport system substrate-binding protein
MKDGNMRTGAASPHQRSCSAAILRIFVASLLGCGQAFAQSAPGITDNEIRLGGIWALSGPVRFVTEPMEQAFNAIFNDTNARGGIHGRQIKWSVEDDGYQPARTLAGAKKLVERDGVFAIVGQVGAPTAAAIVPYAMQVQTPLLIIGAIPKPEPKYVFGMQASYSDLMYQLTRHLIATAGIKKLGYLYQNDDLGEIGRQGMARALKELNAEALLVSDIGYERGSTDFGTQVLRLRDAGAEAVISMGTVASTATAIKQSAAAGYRPTWGTYAVGASSSMQKLIGDLVDGMVFTMETESAQSDSPGVTKATRLVKTYFPKAQLDYNMMLGYAIAELAVKALDASGRDLTRENFVRAIEAMGKYEGDVMPVSLSATKHTGAEDIRVFQWKSGKPIPVSDWLPINAVR